MIHLSLNTPNFDGKTTLAERIAGSDVHMVLDISRTARNFGLNEQECSLLFEYLESGILNDKVEAILDKLRIERGSPTDLEDLVAYKFVNKFRTPILESREKNAGSIYLYPEYPSTELAYILKKHPQIQFLTNEVDPAELSLAKQIALLTEYWGGCDRVANATASNELVEGDSNEKFAGRIQNWKSQNSIPREHDIILAAKAWLRMDYRLSLQYPLLELAPTLQTHPQILFLTEGVDPAELPLQMQLCLLTSYWGGAREVARLVKDEDLNEGKKRTQVENAVSAWVVDNTRPTRSDMDLAIKVWSKMDYKLSFLHPLPELAPILAMHPQIRSLTEGLDPMKLSLRKQIALFNRYWRARRTIGDLIEPDDIQEPDTVKKFLARKGTWSKDNHAPKGSDMSLAVKIWSKMEHVLSLRYPLIQLAPILARHLPVVSSTEVIDLDPAVLPLGEQLRLLNRYGGGYGQVADRVKLDELEPTDSKEKFSDRVRRWTYKGIAPLESDMNLAMVTWGKIGKY